MLTSDELRPSHQCTASHDSVQGASPPASPPAGGTPPVNPPPSGSNRLIGTAQVARILGISERGVRAKADAGELPGFKIGKLWKFCLADVWNWLDERKAAYKNGKNDQLRHLRNDEREAKPHTANTKRRDDE
jgi:excisionase family DNA binding protein